MLRLYGWRHPPPRRRSPAPWSMARIRFTQVTLSFINTRKSRPEQDFSFLPGRLRSYSPLIPQSARPHAVRFSASIPCASGSALAAARAFAAHCTGFSAFPGLRDALHFLRAGHSDRPEPTGGRSGRDSGQGRRGTGAARRARPAAGGTGLLRRHVHRSARCGAGSLSGIRRDRAGAGAHCRFPLLHPA